MEKMEVETQRQCGLQQEQEQQEMREKMNP